MHCWTLSALFFPPLKKNYLTLLITNYIKLKGQQLTFKLRRR